MSLDGAAFSPKEFGLAIKAESTIGSKVVTGMTRMNVDSVEMPSFNLTQVLEARSGSSGRLTHTEDVFIDDKGRKFFRYLKSHIICEIPCKRSK